MTFRDKVVLVTGGSSGIGATTAVKFSKEGAKIAIVGRNLSKLKNTIKQCEGYANVPFIIIADLSVEEDIKQVINKTLEQFGKLDILVNNLGVCGSESILSDKALETFNYMMTINLKAAVHLTHFAAPHLIITKGCIVNVSSIGSSAVLSPENFAYCASKAALDHFTRGVALELSTKGVRVNLINPGPVKTDCLNQLIPDKIERDKTWDDLANLSALGRVCEPEEIADLILFVASDKAKGITGSSFVIDNGMLLKSQ